MSQVVSIDTLLKTGERTVAPSCIAWFPIVIVGPLRRRIVLLSLMLFQVPRGAEASAVRGRWWWSAKKTESEGDAMVRGHEGSAWKTDLL